MITRWASAALLFALAVGQSAAQTAPPSGLVKTRLMPPTYAVTAPDYALKRFERPGEDAAAVFAFLAGKTRLVSSPGVPLQVVYAAPDGAIFLWFPSTGEVRRGRWHIEERKWQLMENGVAIKTHVAGTACFNYSGAIPNIFAPESQRSTNCLSLDFIRRTMLDRRDGDLFRLSSGQARRPLGPIDVRKIEDLARRS